VNSNKVQQQMQDDKNTEAAYMEDEILSFHNDNFNEPRRKTDIYRSPSKDNSHKTKQVRVTPDCLQKLESEGGIKLSSKSSFTSNSQF
jgi:hypothetical protein